MNEKKLTVVITTYNRKESLIEQLNSLRCQGHYQDYCILVTDNHSDYDVKEWLESQLPPDFMSIIEVKVWPYNTGHELNASLAFMDPVTEWMWLLSDDDLTEPFSLQTILNDIEKEENKDVCWIKYSISGSIPNKDCYANTVKEVFDYYRDKPAGDFIFVCNNVYRLTYLRKFITNMLVYCDNCISPELLPLYAIKHDQKKVHFSPIPLTNYVAGRLSWKLIWAYSRFGNILVSDLYMSRDEILAFKKISFFSSRSLITCLSGLNGRTLRHEFFKKIFISHYTIFSLRGIKCFIFYGMLFFLGGKYWNLQNVWWLKGKKQCKQQILAIFKKR